MAALDELQLDPARRDDLVRQYRRLNSPFASIYGLLDRVAAEDEAQGVSRAAMLPVSRPEGMSVAEAVQSGEAQFAVPQGLFDMLSGSVGAIDAPSAAARGLIPAQDMPAEALGAAGMAMLGGGLLTRPAGSVGMGGRVARDFDVSRRDASNIFGKGSERVRYTDPQSGGTMEVVVRPNGQASVLELEVPEEFRGQGIGQSLQARVMQDFPVMGGQVSSKAAATTAYRLGRRPYGQPDATLEDVFRMIDEDSSVNLISPAAQPTDLSANRSTATGLLASAASDTPAQRVARLLREGRADEVTDDLMAQADPQEMFRLYEAGETGMDLPLDRQSRFQRAREMGFDVNNILYHGTAADFPAFDASRGGSVTGARSARAATWLSDDPDVAQGYAAFAADRAVQDLIDRSYRAEVDGDFDLSERLMREAERVEAAGVEGANIISAYGPRNLRRVDMAGEQYDPDDMSLSGLLSEAQQSGASGLELTEFIDNADFANMRSASHRGIFNPSNIRSEFARFDPRLSNLRNLSAANVDPLTGAAAVSASQQDDPLANLRAYIAAAGGVLPR